MTSYIVLVSSYNIFHIITLLIKNVGLKIHLFKITFSLINSSNSLQSIYNFRRTPYLKFLYFFAQLAILVTSAVLNRIKYKKCMFCNQ